MRVSWRMKPQNKPAQVVALPSKSTSLPVLIAREHQRQRRRRWIWLGAVVAIAVAGVGTWLSRRPRPAPMADRFRTAEVTHGNLVREVRATGHVQAVSTVAVGAEISGRIASVEVDYNDQVKAGQILAHFDRTALEAQRAQSTSLVVSAKAQAEQARFDLLQATRNAKRAEELFERQALAAAERETATTAVSLAGARVRAAQATLAAQEASATVARTNLDHAVIRAPIDGVIITRDVDPGQTVASMLQTPVLFTLAADLTKMEVIAAVDEADIAEVTLGQVAPFTVNAYQHRTFEGVVAEVRNAARVVQDVVTYGAVISISNVDLALKPSMTASVKIRTGLVENVDQVPNAALLFAPPGEPLATTPGVWTLDGQHLHHHAVTAGLSDGELTAIAAGELPAGSKVIIDLTPAGKKAYAQSSTKGQ